MPLGEDGEWLMIDGHVPAGAVRDVWGLAGMDRVEDEGDLADLTKWTWARRLEACEEHPDGDDEGDDDCGVCQIFNAGEGPLWNWAVPDGQPSDFNRGAPGYFPVTVVDTEG
jgi:hypothetical protein